MERLEKLTEKYYVDDLPNDTWNHILYTEEDFVEKDENGNYYFVDAYGSTAEEHYDWWFQACLGGEFLDRIPNAFSSFFEERLAEDLASPIEWFEQIIEIISDNLEFTYAETDEYHSFEKHIDNGWYGEKYACLTIKKETPSETVGDSVVRLYSKYYKLPRHDETKEDQLDMSYELECMFGELLR